MTTVNAINDLGTISKIPNKVLDSLFEKLNLCIGSAIHDAKLTDQDSVIINIGIGTLSVNLADMQCKFVPSRDLKNAIKRCLDTNVDPVELALEKALADKLIAICTEVL